MIILNNHSKIGTYIVVKNGEYQIVEKEKIQLVRQGVGGFSDDGELFGIYVQDNMFFFCYNLNSFQALPYEVICRNEKIVNGKRNFQVQITGKTVCNITYEPYVSPFILTHDDSEEEFDILLYLSNLMKDKDTISNFIRGIKSLNSELDYQQ